MTGNFIKPPSMGEGGGPVDLPSIYEAAGLPPEHLTAEFIRSHIIPCVAATFSDGELVIQHPPEQDPVVQEHFGATSYDQGAFGRRLRELFEGDDLALRHQVDGLIRYSATVFAHDAALGNVQLPSKPTVNIDSSRGTIGFDRMTVPLSAEPRVVIDYGPGLQGRFHTERQLSDWNAGKMPYTYLGIGKGPFVNQFLQSYWAARLGDPQLANSVIGRLYIGREDGIAAATTEFAAVQQQHTGTSEFADVVVASGIHTAGHDEVNVGITNAHKLLKPGGTLLIRAPKAPNQETPGSVPAEAMVAAALSAGFDQDKAQFFDTRTGGDVGPRVDSLSAVFRK